MEYLSYLFKIDDLDAIEQLITPKTKLIYAESPTNPGVDILDLEALGKIAKKHNLILVIDNCFASPYLQQPIKFGADLVIHSGTKLMDGQGRVLAGITVGSSGFIDKVYRFSRITGPALSPFNAWVLSKVWKPWRFGWIGIARMRSNLPSSWKVMTRWNG